MSVDDHHGPMPSAASSPGQELAQSVRTEPRWFAVGIPGTSVRQKHSPCTSAAMQTGTCSFLSDTAWAAQEDVRQQAATKVRIQRGEARRLLVARSRGSGFDPAPDQLRLGHKPVTRTLVFSWHRTAGARRQYSVVRPANQLFLFLVLPGLPLPPRLLLPQRIHGTI